MPGLDFKFVNQLSRRISESRRIPKLINAGTKGRGGAISFEVFETHGLKDLEYRRRDGLFKHGGRTMPRRGRYNVRMIFSTPLPRYGRRQANRFPGNSTTSTMRFLKAARPTHQEFLPFLEIPIIFQRTPVCVRPGSHHLGLPLIPGYARGFSLLLR